MIIAGIYPKEYSGLRQYQIDKAGITFDNEAEQLQKIADIINTKTTNDSNEQLIEHTKQCRGFDFGWNFHYIIDYFEIISNFLYN